MTEETQTYLPNCKITNYLEMSSKCRTRPGGFQDEITEYEIAYEQR